MFLNYTSCLGRVSFGPLEFEVGDVVEWRRPSGAIMGPSEKIAQEGIQSLQDILFSGVFSFWPMIS